MILLKQKIQPLQIIFASTIFLVSILFLLVHNASADNQTYPTADNIMIVYPKRTDAIACASTFLIGSCPAGSTLLCNNQPVRTNTQGYFAQVVNLQPGLNSFEFILDNSSRYIYIVKRILPPPKAVQAHTHIIKPPHSALTLQDDTIVRTAPDQTRTTPLPQGVHLLVDGQQGNSMRCRLESSRHVWIKKNSLKLGGKVNGPPTAIVKAISINDDQEETNVVVALSQALPFQLKQELNPNRLIVKIYGAHASHDGFAPLPGTSFVHYTYNQLRNYFELHINLKGNRQWGYRTDYQGSNLVLHIKHPPQIQANKLPLSGVTICLDPGHGGNESGSIGPSGIKEAEINLAIAEKLKPLLEADGAKIIMTRTSDKDVSLESRVRTAINSKVDLLISIHNNALPDGHDPWVEHGTAAYWYQPQSVPLADSIKKSLMLSLDFPNHGTNFKSLALARPSNMIAVLVEVGFMIYPDEYAQLIRPDIQQVAASAIEKAIYNYLLPGRQRP